MRFAGTGLLIIGALVAAAAMAVEDSGGALIAVVAGGFLFLAGAVFAASAGIQDAIGRK